MYHVVMDTEYAWAAGFIDGEGTITIKRYKSQYTVKKIHYQPYVSASQANHVGHYKAIKRMQKLFGGSLCIYKAKPPKLEYLSWSVVSRDAVACLKKIRPYLQIKNRHADILLSYYEKAGKKAKGYRLTDNELAEREKLWIELRSINQKGKLYLQRLNEPTPDEGM